MQKFAFIPLVAAALAASDVPNPLGDTTSYTGTLASSYYAALDAFYGQPSVAAAVEAARTLASDDTSGYNAWVTSFYGQYGGDFQSIASEYADVFTQNDMESGSVSIGSVADSDVSDFLNSVTASGDASSVASGVAAANLRNSTRSGGAGSGSKSGSGSDSKSGSGSKSGSDSKSGSASASGTSGSSSSTDNGGARSGSFMAAGGVAGAVALALL